MIGTATETLRRIQPSRKEILDHLEDMRNIRYCAPAGMIVEIVGVWGKD